MRAESRLGRALHRRLPRASTEPRANARGGARVQITAEGQNLLLQRRRAPMRAESRSSSPLAGLTWTLQRSREP